MPTWSARNHELVDEARDRVLLHAERRHPPGVDDVAGGQQHADFLADRHDQRTIDVQQVIAHRVGIDAGIQLPRSVAVTRERREEGDVAIEILVMPAPLETRDLDRQLGVARVLDAHQRRGGRNRHRHQDHDRDDRPDDLGAGGVIEVRGDRALRAAEFHDRVDHHAEHRHGDRHADPQDQHVQSVDAAAQLRDADRHVQLPGRERRRGQAGQDGGQCAFDDLHH